MSIGTLDWARRTGGKLNFRDKLVLSLEGMKSTLRDIPPLLWWKMGLPIKQPSYIDLVHQPHYFDE